MSNPAATAYQTIQELNPHVRMHHVTDSAFDRYGQILEGYTFGQIEELMNETPVPTSGNIYRASDEVLEKTPIYDVITSNLYGGQPVQIGYCNGVNSFLNGLEYHKSSEVNITITDLVLLLGRVQDIDHNGYDVNLVDAFFVPKGTAIEVYGTTLHYGPCKVSDQGFKCVVILPKGTNAPLESNINQITEEDALLFMKNKWLLVHPDRIEQIKNGAFPGIRGENIEVFYK